MQLLAEAVPSISSIAYLTADSAGFNFGPVEDAAREIGVKLSVVTLDVPKDETAIGRSFERMRMSGVGAILLGALDSSFVRPIALLAQANSLPAEGIDTTEFAQAGGLMAYGINFGETNRMSAEYVGRILRGEKPGDLPVWPNQSLELVVNITTARKLGLNLSVNFLARADLIIE